MKKILGLDLGTNSIGWALVEIDHKSGIVRILGLGSRIIPMSNYVDSTTGAKSKDPYSDFIKGKGISAAKARTDKRGTRRQYERFALRRDRLHLILGLLDSLPHHYRLEIDFERKGEKCGQFKHNTECKIAYIESESNSKKKNFIYEEAYKEMLLDMGIEDKKGSRIPRDWTLYYLRQKALKKKITLEEFAWVLLSYNQKRGYEKLDVEEESTKAGQFKEILDLQVLDVTRKTDADGRIYFQIELNGNDGFSYKEYSNEQMTFKDDLKEVVKISKVTDDGNIDPKKTEFTVIDIYSLTIEKVVHQIESGKHQYTLTFINGWKELNETNKYTFKYQNIERKSFDYIVETVYDAEGNVNKVRGNERKLREPDFGDNSSDWTLLKKKTEKAALRFNAKHGHFKADGSVKNYISLQIYDILKSDAKKEKEGNHIQTPETAKKIEKQVKDREEDKKNRVLYSKEKVPVSESKVNFSSVLEDEIKKMKNITEYNKKTQ